MLLAYGTTHYNEYRLHIRQHGHRLRLRGYTKRKRRHNDCGRAEELSPADAAVFDSLFSASILNETPERAPRAYDKKRDGLVVGEGAATLILEE